eukprot:653957-Lingulodinium_polyedra.AAC.1
MHENCPVIKPEDDPTDSRSRFGEVVIDAEAAKAAVEAAKCADAEPEPTQVPAVADPDRPVSARSSGPQTARPRKVVTPPN